MTTAPNALTASINHERMTVLLSTNEQFDAWMKGSPADAIASAHPPGRGDADCAVWS
jgi:putative SOS response-associated peptidase YedK